MSKGSQGGIVYKNALLEVRKAKVQKAVVGLRKRWNIPEQGFQQDNEYWKWLNDLIAKPAPGFSPNKSGGFPSSYSHFLQDIANEILPIIKKPKLWIYFFASYITTGKISSERVLRSGKTYATPRIKILSVDNNKSYPITICIDLKPNTIADNVYKAIRQIWAEVKSIQKTLPEYDNTRKKRMLPEDIMLLGAIGSGSKLKKDLYDKSAPDDKDHVRSLEAMHKGVQRTRKAIKGQ